MGGVGGEVQNIVYFVCWWWWCCAYIHERTRVRIIICILPLSLSYSSFFSEFVHESSRCLLCRSQRESERERNSVQQQDLGWKVNDLPTSGAWLFFFLSFQSKVTTYDKEEIADENTSSSRILLHSGLPTAANQISVPCASSENTTTGYTPDSQPYDAFR